MRQTPRAQVSVIWTVVLTLLLALSVGTVPQQAQATTSPFDPVTKFAIDGNIDAPSDWGDPLGSGLYGPYTTTQSYPSAGIITSALGQDPCAGDSTGYPGSQTQDTNPWVRGVSNVNKKADLCRAGAAVELVDVNGEYQYIYYAYWARRPDGTGDFNAFTVLEGPLPGRIDDRMISFDYSPATDSMKVTVLRWSGTQWVLTSTLTNTQFQYAVGRNTALATEGSTTAGAATLAEVAVNLTTSRTLPSDSCGTFTASGTITRTGNSASAQLEDYIDFAQPLTVKECGSIQINKATSPANTDGGPFTYVLSQVDGDVVHDGSLVYDGKATATTTDDEPDLDTSTASITGTLTTPSDTRDTFGQVIGAPDYLLQETNLPSGWSLKDVQCTYYNPFAGQIVTESVLGKAFQIPSDTFGIPTNCTITNETSTIRVAKTGAGASTEPFVFNVTGKPDQSLLLGQSTGYLAYTPGTAVTITENLPTTTLPWKLVSVSCVDDQTGLAVTTTGTGTSRTVTTVGGHNITCTYTNQQQAEIRVTKDIAPDDATKTFDFTWNGVPGATTSTLHDGESSAWYIVDPNTGLVPGATAGGTYTVTETTDPNYQLAAIVCNDGDSTFSTTTATTSFRVSPGESVRCTYVNTVKGSVTIIKKAIPLSAQDFSFTTTVSNGGVLPTGMGSFTLDNDGGPPPAGVGDNTYTSSLTWTAVSTGTYTVTETATPGWNLTALSCTEQVGGNTRTSVASRQATIVVDPDDIIVCTYENTQKTAPFTLTKNWVGAPAGDEIELFTQGTVNTTVVIGHSTSTGPTSTTGDTQPAVRQIYAGGPVHLDESFLRPPGGAANYNTTLSCIDAGPDGIAGNGDDRSYSAASLGFGTDPANPLAATFPTPLDPSATVCTYVNDVKNATLQLYKDWGDSPPNATPPNNPTVDLTVTGVLATDTATNSNDGNNTNDGYAEIPVLVGRSPSVSETFTGSVASRYTTSLSCVNYDANGNLVVDGNGNPVYHQINYSTGQLSGTVPILSADENQTIRCTFSNIRHRETLHLLKSWLFGAPGDSTQLYLDSTNPVTHQTQTSTVPPLPTDVAGRTTYVDPLCGQAGGPGGSITDGTCAHFLDTANQLAVTAYGGEAVSLGEVLATGNTGTYFTTIVCRDEAGDFIRGFTGTSGSYVIPDDPAKSAGDFNGDGIVDVTCTVENARQYSDVWVQKAWTNAIAGDTVDLFGIGMQSRDTDTATSTAGGTDGTGTPTTTAGTFLPGTTLDTGVQRLDANGNPVFEPTTGEPDYVNVAHVFTLTGGRVYISEVLGAGNTVPYLTASPTCTYVDPAGATQTVTPVPATQADADLAGRVLSSRDYIVPVPSDAGLQIYCTYDNTAPRGTITVVKNVVGPDGTFDFTRTWEADSTSATPLDPPVDFQLTTTGGTASVQYDNVLAGTYTLTEADHSPTYDRTTLVCVETNGDPQNVTTVDSATFTGTIRLDAGESVTCTYTNTAQTSQVSVTKTVTGSTITPWSFPVTITPTPTGATSPQSMTDTTPTVTWTGLVPGTSYTISEGTVTGYNQGAMTCTGVTDTDGSTTNASVTFTAPLNTDATNPEVVCSISNPAQTSQVSVTKTVTGSTITPWSFPVTITPTPTGATSPQSMTDTTPTVTWTGLVPGTSYTISEGTVTGYNQGAMTCTGVTDTDGSTTNASVTFTAPLNTDATNPEVVCSISNPAQTSQVSVTKTVTGVDAGVSWSFPFTLTTAPTGQPATQNATGTGPSISAPVTWTGLVPGTSYTISEGTVTGYNQGAMTCTGVTDTDGSTTNASVTFTAPLNTDATNPEVVCSISNPAQPATLRLDKVVANTQGGNGLVTQFPMSATGTAGTVAAQTSVTGVTDTIPGAGTTNSQLVNAGTYRLSETLSAGYSASAWSCWVTGDPAATVPVVAGAPGSGLGDVTLDRGQDVTCRITNADLPVDLSIVKSDGGAKLVAGQQFTYTLTVDNVGQRDVDLGEPTTVTDTLPTGLTFASSPDGCTSPSPQVVTCGIDAALLQVADPPVVLHIVVNVAPTAVAGTYQDMAIVTTPDDQPPPGADCTNESNNVSCVTTELPPAHVTLLKTVINDDGGTAVDTDFTLGLGDGEGALTTGVEGDPGITAYPVGVTQPAYYLFELSDPGYTPTGWSCVYTGTTTPVATSDTTVARQSTWVAFRAIALRNGTDVTCTVTNDDNNVDLVVTKTDGGITAKPATTFPYTITVRNSGTQDVSADDPVTLTDVLPPQLDYVSGPPECSADGQTVTCSLDPADLTAGGPGVQIVLQVQFRSGTPSGTYTNLAYVDSVEDPAPPSPQCIPANGAGLRRAMAAATDPANNVACEDTPLVSTHGLTATKSAFEVAADGSRTPTDGTVDFGSTVAYDIAVEATGDAPQTNVTLTDPIPVGTTYVVGSGHCVAPATCTVTFDAATHTLTAVIGGMAPGDRVVVSVSVTVDPAPAMAAGMSYTWKGVNVAAAHSTEVPGDVPSNPVTVTATKSEMPKTGTEAATLAMAGLGTLLAGVLLVLVTRRRRPGRR